MAGAVFLSFVIIILEVFVSYKKYSKILKYLALTLLTYVLTAFISKPNWGAIFQSTVLPQIKFSSEYMLNIVAILGTTISPYLFFWQTSQEVEEEIADGKTKEMGVGKPAVRQKNIKNMDLDTIVGMVFSQAIMFLSLLPQRLLCMRTG